MYRFIQAHASAYAIETQCRVPSVSRSTYYEWLQGGWGSDADEKKKETEQEIIRVFGEHRRRYGVRRLIAELKGKGIQVSAYRVRKVLKKYGLSAIQPRSFVPRTTDSRHPYPISPNLLEEKELPGKPDQVWVGDITYIPLAGGSFLYLAVWIDLFSRKIIGWQLEAHMKEELVIAAFKKALQKRSVMKGLIVHSDRGGQYAGKEFRKLLGTEVLQSMSRAHNPYDNAFMESCFSRFKAELLQGGAGTGKMHRQRSLNL